MGHKISVILGKDDIEYLLLLLYRRIWNLKAAVISETFPSHLISKLKQFFYTKKYAEESIEEYKTNENMHKDFWPMANSEVIELTLRFYKHNIMNGNRIIAYYNNILHTRKFEAYIKKKISYDIFNLLKVFHTITPANLEDREILMVNNPLNKFVAKYAKEKYKIGYNIKWVAFPWHIFFMFTYYKWLLREFAQRQVVFNRPKKEYKLSKEASWRFSRSTLRDDIAIDEHRIKKKDILMLQFSFGKEAGRDRAFKQAKETGFDTASLPNLKINLNKNFLAILFFYFLTPFITYFKLLLNGMGYLMYYILYFHRECFPVEILMNSYNIKCHMSVMDCDDIATSIILNKFNCKNTLFHWSDQSYFDFKHNFKAHDIFFTWGNIHDRHYPGTSYIGKRINIGCIFKKAYDKALKDKTTLVTNIPNFRMCYKTVAFFDTAPDVTYGLERLCLECLDVMEKLCQQRNDINVLFKPKFEWGHILNPTLDSKYKNRWIELLKHRNFISLAPEKWSAEEVIAISDVCVSVGMNTTSTTALICGKNALYLDDTNNYDDHPFYKYRGTLVFGCEEIIDQIHNILKGKFDCRDVISEEELCQYDAFRDNGAIERMRKILYDLTTNSG